MTEPKTISLVVAMDDQQLIGANGQLPWRLPNDLKHFKAVTLGKTVLMGRKTWDSLGRPLPQRDNWVLTRAPDFAPAGARVFHDLSDALAAHAGGELMVIGGADLYRQTLPLAQCLHLTQVHAQFSGDTWFPQMDPADWQELGREDHCADERHPCSYSFLTLVRRRAGA